MPRMRLPGGNREAAMSGNKGENMDLHRTLIFRARFAFAFCVAALAASITDAAAQVCFPTGIELPPGPPFIVSGSATFALGSFGSFTVTAAGMGALSVSLDEGLPPWAIPGQPDGPAKVIVSGTPPSGSVGTYAVLFTSHNECGSVPGVVTLTVVGISQTIEFGAIPTHHPGDVFTVSATGGASGQPVTFSSQTPAVCSSTGTNGSTITAIKRGSCTIRASQAASANGDYVVAPDVDRIFMVDISTVDFDGNGTTDLVWTHTDGSAVLWLMNGTSATGSQQFLGANTGWSVVHTADFNGDHKSDIVWQNTDGRMAIYLMNGLTPIQTTQLLNAGSGWTVTHTPDLNGDGNADLVFENTDGTTAVWTMDGTTVTGGATLMGAGTGWHVTQTGDFDGDGNDDLLWTNDDGRVAIWLMNGTSVNAMGQILDGGTGWSVSHVADLDGDGKADIVWQHSDGSVAAWLMNGTTMSSGAGILGAGTGWSVFRVADFDDDGKADLLFQHTDGRVAIYLMNGLTPSATRGILGAGSGWTPGFVGDLNGDGMADIVWTNVDGRTAFWLMNGTTPLQTNAIGAFPGWSVSPLDQH